MSVMCSIYWKHILILSIYLRYQGHGAFKSEATGKESVILSDIHMSAALLDFFIFFYLTSLVWNGIKSQNSYTRWDFYKYRRIVFMFLICYDKNEK